MKYKITFQLFGSPELQTTTTDDRSLIEAIVDKSVFSHISTNEVKNLFPEDLHDYIHWVMMK